MILGRRALACFRASHAARMQAIRTGCTKAGLTIYVPGFSNVDKEADGYEKTAAMVAGIFGLARHWNGAWSIIPSSMPDQHYHSPDGFQ